MKLFRIILISIILYLIKTNDSTNLKRVNNFIANNGIQEELNYSNTISFIQSKFDLSELFKHVFDRNFLCFILIYSENNPIILFTTFIIIEIIIIYMDLYVNFKFTSIIPIDIFKLLAMIMYYLFAFTILYKLMFMNMNKKKIKRDLNEDSTQERNIFLREIDSVIKIAGMIFINHMIIYEDTLNILDVKFTLIAFISTIVCKFLFAGLALLIGFIIDNNFSNHCILMFSCITFFLLSIDITVKYFSQSMSIR